jgi:hypothetical protein
MVAPELGEPMLLYIVAITKVMSMVLVVERPEPMQPQALKGAPAAGSGSQDLDPAEGSRVQEASGSQFPKPTLIPEPQIGSRLLEAPSGPKDQEASGPQTLEPTSCPDNQHTIGSQLPKAPLGPGG